MSVQSQQRPRFFKDNVIAILASNLRLICPKFPELSVYLLLQKMYSKHPQVLSSILSHKHATNKKQIDLIKKFAIIAVYKIVLNKK